MNTIYTLKCIRASARTKTESHVNTRRCRDKFYTLNANRTQRTHLSVNTYSRTYIKNHCALTCEGVFVKFHKRLQKRRAERTGGRLNREPRFCTETRILYSRSNFGTTAAAATSNNSHNTIERCFFPPHTGYLLVDGVQHSSHKYKCEFIVFA